MNLHELEPLARARLTEQAYAYLAGGSGDEHTLGWNTAAWQRIKLAPRFLVDVSAIDTRLSLLGHDLVAPILLAPTAAHLLFHPNGELETVRGATAAEALFILSSLASLGVQDVGAAARGPGVGLLGESFPCQRFQLVQVHRAVGLHRRYLTGALTSAVGRHMQAVPAGAAVAVALGPVARQVDQHAPAVGGSTGRQPGPLSGGDDEGQGHAAVGGQVLG